MNRFAAFIQSRRNAAGKSASHERTHRRYLRSGMTAEMADLLVTMAKILEMSLEERRSTFEGQAMQAKYREYYRMAENDFEAIAESRGFPKFKRELDRLSKKAADQAKELQA
ncbi:hypothetical protein [Rhodanobacter geophilus]|uniref:Uncharacterized protein n=1 Tax=Rhodanobacter geophilus TaxID=3162488 RepID=A0ABV3QMH3_9GAMM